MKLLVLFLGAIFLSDAAFADCSTVTMGAKPEGYVFHNADYDVHQVCLNSEWQALGPIKCPAGDGCPPEPTNCDNVGDSCDDGSIFAGLSPDGSIAMYTTATDAPSTYAWNDGTTNYTDMSMENCTDASPGTAAACRTGEANTAFLVGATGETDYPFAAAEYCDGLSAHGYSDWYLPAQDELNVLYANKNTGDLSGTFNETGDFPTGGYYWSSSEFNDSYARNQRFSDGAQGNFGFKVSSGLSVRCVRR